MNASILRTLQQKVTQSIHLTLASVIGLASMSGIAPLLFVGSASAAVPVNAYNTIPGSIPGAFSSLGYAATSTSEFGDYIKLTTAANRYVQSVSVNLTNWACENDFTLTGSTWTPNRAASDACVTTPGSTYAHPITVNIYNVDNSGPTPVAGSLIKSVTRTVDVPFRPSYDAAHCGTPASDTPFGGKWFDAATNTCVHGKAFTATFDFSSFVQALPRDVIVTTAYNTSHYGTAPMGQVGPYDSLNVSVDGVIPSEGTDVNSDAVFWKTLYPGYTNTLSQDTGWAGNVPLLRVVTLTDDTAPTIAFTNPTDFSTPFQAGPNASFTATDDLSGVASTSIQVKRNTFPFNQVKLCNSLTATVTCNLSSLGDGSYRLIATTTDNAGNTRTENRNFTIDSTKPSVNIVAPSYAQWVGDTFNVGGTAFDLNSGVDRVDYKVTKISAIGGSYISDVTSGTASGTTFWNFGVSGLAQGYYRVSATAVDNAGNTRKDTVDVRVDATDPAINFLSPTDFSNPFQVGPNFSIKATDTSGSGIATTRLRIYHDNGTLAKFCPTSFSSTTSCNAAALSEGDYYVVATARDNVGNVTTVTKDFTIDTTAALVTVDSQTSTTALPTLTGTVNDPDATVAVTVNGHTYNAVVSGTTWSVQVTDLLSNSTYDVVAAATDLAGNVSTDATTNELTVNVPVATSSTNTTITVSSIFGARASSSTNSGSGSASTGEVLGDNSAILSTTTKDSNKGADTNKKVETSKSSAFLGLGWWWLIVLAIALALGYWFIARRSDRD